MWTLYPGSYEMLVVNVDLLTANNLLGCSLRVVGVFGAFTPATLHLVFKGIHIFLPGKPQYWRLKPYSDLEKDAAVQCFRCSRDGC